MDVRFPTLKELCLRKASTTQTNVTLDNIIPRALFYKLCSPNTLYSKPEYPSKAQSDFQSPWICTGDRTLSDDSTTLVEFSSSPTSTSLSPPPSRPCTPPPPPSLYIVGGSLGTDLLQFYIDSANESGSLHDERFNKEFWDCLEKSFVLSTTAPSSPPPSKKQKSSSPSSSISFSLHNCTLLSTTAFSTFASSSCGLHIQTLDLSGCFLLTSALLIDFVLPSVPNVERLSLKNCRKMDDLGVNAIHENLKSLRAIDLGGCFNVTKEACISLSTSPKSILNELHFSGMGWDGVTLTRLLKPYHSSKSKPRTLLALSIGFSPLLTPDDLTDLLLPVIKELTSLSLHFSIKAVNNDVMEMIGREGLNIAALDIRGCTNVTSIVEFLDSRAQAFNELSATASEQPPLKKVFIITKYSSVPDGGGAASVELFDNLFTAIS